MRLWKVWLQQLAAHFEHSGQLSFLQPTAETELGSGSCLYWYFSSSFEKSPLSGTLKLDRQRRQVELLALIFSLICPTRFGGSECYCFVVALRKSPWDGTVSDFSSSGCLENQRSPDKEP